MYYPSSFAVQNVYDAKGFLVSVVESQWTRNLLEGGDIHELGRVTSEVFGNGVSAKKVFQAETGRPLSIAAGKDGQAILNLTLQYDLVGNLIQRKELTEVTPNGRANIENFKFDGLDRLVEQSSPDEVTQQYTFDAAGRITFKSGVGDYRYCSPIGMEVVGEDPAACPYHAVSSTKMGESSRATYGYDLNGNMVRGPGSSFEYTADNRMKLLFADQRRWIRFDYAPSGERYRSTAVTGINTVETLYLGTYERVTEFWVP